MGKSLINAVLYNIMYFALHFFTEGY